MYFCAERNSDFKFEVKTHFLTFSEQIIIESIKIILNFTTTATLNVCRVLDTSEQY